MKEYLSGTCFTAIAEADTDGDGEISLAEALDVAHDYFDTDDVSKEQAICVVEEYGFDPCNAAIAEADTDEDGEISAAEVRDAVDRYFDSDDAPMESVICVVGEYLSQLRQLRLRLASRCLYRRLRRAGIRDARLEPPVPRRFPTLRRGKKRVTEGVAERSTYPAVTANHGPLGPSQGICDARIFGDHDSGRRRPFASRLAGRVRL